MTDFEWTTERMNALRVMANHGMTAKEIGAVFGITRNAVLGKCHRLNISLDMTEEKRTKANQRLSAWHKRRLSTKKTRTKTSLEKLKDAGMAEKLSAMRAARMTWGEIAKQFDVTTPTARNWAINLGVLSPNKFRYITKEDIDTLIQMWNEYRHVNEIAAKIGRSFDVTRQIILRLQDRGQISHRDPLRAIAVYRYGCDYKDPRPGRIMLTEAQVKRKERELNDIDIKRRAHEDAVIAALEQMADNIENGMAREEAMVEARKVCTLEEIGACFGITRERVRQICAKLEKRKEDGEGCSSDDGRSATD